MVFPKHTLPIALVLLLALIVVACGNGSPGSSGGRYYNGNSSTPATTGSSTNAVIQTAMATLKGKSMTILTNAQGRTLYYLTADTSTTVACSGSCASVWPPLLSTSTPTSAASLPGPLSMVATANGNQAEYNGHPLYTYSGDTAAGQTNGEGVSNTWFVVTPDLAPPAQQPSGY